jgi:hypothetical protein
MRLLFLFLLLVNALIFSWYNFNQQPLSAAPMSINTSAPRLVLISELPPEQPSSIVVAEESPLTGEQEKPVPQKQCFTLGPFMNNEDVASATEKLMLSGRPFEKRASEKKEQIGYWVYLPPFKNRDAAIQVAEEFKLLGDKHFYVVNTPAEYANAVSLGVFQGKSNAQRRYRQLKNLGYDVKLQGRYRQNPVYWLDYTEEADSQQINMQDFVGAQSLARSCEVIASSDPLP